MISLHNKIERDFREWLTKNGEAGATFGEQGRSLRHKKFYWPFSLTGIFLPRRKDADVPAAFHNGTTHETTL